METPVYDFVQEYIKKNPVRFHMPGHKGKSFLGCEAMDITEIEGADLLSHASGILKESQQNAARLFGSGATFYGTEGSSQCIKAMMAAVLCGWRRKQGEGVAAPWILAARNVHRAMVDGCALLDLEVKWIPFTQMDSIYSIHTEPDVVRQILSGCDILPVGVYLTSPDYLGVQSDIREMARICHQYDVPLLVDNAHGAYLAFCEEKQHPIALGADLCCDSAHKTLPVLTGGAYLHIGHEAMGQFGDDIPGNLSLFGSTSPSYLILQSLDLCNRYLSGGYSARLKECVRKIGRIKKELTDRGIAVKQGEPLKIVIDTAVSGYTGQEIAAELRDFSGMSGVGGMECEYADARYLVLMLTPENRGEDFSCLREWSRVSRLNNPKEPLASGILLPVWKEKRRMSIREAVLSASETVLAREAVGRILAQETVSCPPAVPIGISGEEVTEEMVRLFQEYGVEEISVVACQG